MNSEILIYKDRIKWAQRIIKKWQTALIEYENELKILKSSYALDDENVLDAIRYKEMGMRIAKGLIDDGFKTIELSEQGIASIARRIEREREFLAPSKEIGNGAVKRAGGNQS